MPDRSGIEMVKANEGVQEVTSRAENLHPSGRRPTGYASGHESGLQSLPGLSRNPGEQFVLPWLPRDLKAEKVVFLPDACPGQAPLPTGTAVLTHQTDWRRFAVSDCGCGMRLLRTRLERRDLTLGLWDELATALRSNKAGARLIQNWSAALALQ
jgi:hypothetical protein